MSGANIVFQEGQTQTPIPASWLNAVQEALFGSGAGTGFVVFAGYGPTINRPTQPVLNSMYIDSDLKEPVWCTEISPSIVWVNSAGVAV